MTQLHQSFGVDSQQGPDHIITAYQALPVIEEAQAPKSLENLDPPRNGLEPDTPINTGINETLSPIQRLDEQFPPSGKDVDKTGLGRYLKKGKLNLAYTDDHLNQNQLAWQIKTRIINQNNQGKEDDYKISKNSKKSLLSNLTPKKQYFPVQNFPDKSTNPQPTSSSRMRIKSLDWTLAYQEKPPEQHGAPTHNMSNPNKSECTSFVLDVGHGDIELLSDNIQECAIDQSIQTIDNRQRMLDDISSRLEFLENQNEEHGI